VLSFVARELFAKFVPCFLGGGDAADCDAMGGFCRRIEEAFEQYERGRLTGEEAGELLVHASGIEGLIFCLVGYASLREAFPYRSSGRAWP
jgi:hypothetical protein